MRIIFEIAEIVVVWYGRGGRLWYQPKDCMGNTPLGWAAGNGHEGVVEILLCRDDINPNKPDEDGQTPLLLAARNGHEGVVKILLS